MLLGEKLLECTSYIIHVGIKIFLIVRKTDYFNFFFNNHNGSQAKLSFQAFQLRPFLNKLIRAFDFVFNTFYKHCLLVYQITISYIFSNGMHPLKEIIIIILATKSLHTNKIWKLFQQRLLFTLQSLFICLHYEASLRRLERVFCQ